MTFNEGVLLAERPSESMGSIFERMVVLHTVFEGAAFAYMSLLSKHEFDRTELEPVKGIAKIIIDKGKRRLQCKRPTNGRVYLLAR